VITAKQLAGLKVTCPLWRFERDGDRVLARRKTVLLSSGNAGTLKAGIASTEHRENWSKS
jgi:hypothetical protein